MWPNPQLPADLVTFNEEILNGKLHLGILMKKKSVNYRRIYKEIRKLFC